MELLLSLDVYEKKYRFKYLALYHALRDMIIQGTLQQGIRLPSSRELAEDYHLSRGIVNQVYEMLVADGYIQSKTGSGTFVSFVMREGKDLENGGTTTYPISEWGKRLPTFIESPNRIGEIGIDFFTGIPCPTHFPIVEWKKAVNQGVDKLKYLTEEKEPDLLGLYDLRESISTYLSQTRGMRVSPDHICIVNGSIQAMAVLIHLLVNTGDRVMVTDPTYKRTRNVIEAVGGIPTPLRLTENGIHTDEGSGRVVFVTPSHEYPTGRIMSLQERTALLEWANRRNAIIIEDDIESELRRKQRPIEPLKALDYQQRVVYLGTFYRTLLPYLRVGYVVLPPDLIEDYIKAQNLFQPFSTSLFEQAAIAQFMRNGSYSRHVRRMQRVYSEKYTFLRQLFAQHLPGAFQWVETKAGLHIFGWWQGEKKTLNEFERRCTERGIRWENPDVYFLENQRPAAMFGFSHLNMAEIERGVRIMGEVYAEKH